MTGAQGSIPLCVPRDRAKQAAGAGARWDRVQRCFFWDTGIADIAENAPVLAFLPFRFRPDRRPPYVRPWMVPQSLWGWNLRAMLRREDWDRIRRDAYRRAGYRCRICGGIGPDHPVEADEGWAYDDTRFVQVLRGVIALCPDCHAVRHWGRSMATGKEQHVLRWLAWINGWTPAQARACADEAMALWHWRSGHTGWTCDIGWVEKVFGVQPVADAMVRAAATQQGLVALARQSRDGEMR
ncbi:hypothetical protein KSAC_34570 (plasmid) [Komagataeibacter saccharivorans]|uniref:HNH endonuclease n=1 Tax=Komagataeibacter saccharivorans TaxID=265959 RepID=UPI0010C52E17|nr:hypothetical protein [Komagataeibacter saccharivorans]QBL95636.1 hypothetical protein KSAC_34570 [Komagataeibacter saccharivorans]